jgi:hypothetical protein
MVSMSARPVEWTLAQYCAHRKSTELSQGLTDCIFGYHPRLQGQKMFCMVEGDH